MRLLYIILGLFATLNLMGQKLNYEPSQVKEITINFNDSIAIINVYSVERNIKTKNNVRYYWYYSNRLHSNIGGYQGNLLHGQYLVLNRNNNLITKGFLKNGAKDGIWKHWYSNGVLKEVNNYKEGIKEGKHIMYNQSGGKIVEENYKNGLLHGDCIYIVNQSILNKKYKNGKLLPVRKNKNTVSKLFGSINTYFKNRRKSAPVESSEIEGNMKEGTESIPDTNITENINTPDEDSGQKKIKIKLFSNRESNKNIEKEETSTTDKQKEELKTNTEKESNNKETKKERLKINAGENSIQKKTGK